MRAARRSRESSGCSAIEAIVPSSQNWANDHAGATVEPGFFKEGPAKSIIHLNLPGGMAQQVDDPPQIAGAHSRKEHEIDRVDRQHLHRQGRRGFQPQELHLVVGRSDRGPEGRGYDQGADDGEEQGNEDARHDGVRRSMRWHPGL